MADGNLQDFFEQRTDGSQLLKGGGIVVGTGPGAKSVVFQNDLGELYLVGNPGAGTVSLNLPSNGGTLIMSGQAVQGLGISTGGNTLGSTGTTIGTVVLAGIGAVTLSQSTAAGSLATISISVPAQTIQPAVTAIGVSTGGNTAGNTGTTQGTYILAGGNQITLSQSTAAGSLATVTISGRDAIFGAGISTGGNTSGTSGTVTGTLVLAGIGNVTLSQSTDAGGATVTISAAAAAGTGVAGLGVSTGGNTAGNTGTTLGTIVLAGGNNITLSQSTAAGSLATITISGMDVVEGLGISNIGNTTGTSGTQFGTIVFAGGNLITLSQSTAGSAATITISANAPKLRSWSYPDMPAGSFGSSNAGFSLQPVQIPINIDATRIAILAHLTAATGSTGSVLFSIGVYTLSGSTASLASSTVRQFSWSSGTTNSTATSVYGGQSGTRYRTIDLGGTWAFSPGNYLFGFWCRSSNVGTWTFYGVDQTVSIAGGADANETQQFLPGFSTSSFSTAMPASINVTDTNYVRTGISAFRQPGYLLVGT